MTVLSQTPKCKTQMIFKGYKTQPFYFIDDKMDFIVPLQQSLPLTVIKIEEVDSNLSALLGKPALLTPSLTGIFSLVGDCSSPHWPPCF